MFNIGQKNSGSTVFPELGRGHPVPADSEPVGSGPAFRRRRRSKDDSIPSSLVMHTLVVGGHRTSVRLEPVIWDALKGIARDQEVKVHDLVSDISRQHIASGLTTAIRVYVVTYLSAELREAQFARFGAGGAVAADAGRRRERPPNG